MKELEIECHKLGIPAKTRHNEVAPNQFELAPIFENANLANDHNQLVMDLMKRIARKHNFAVLLHEKPYSGVNGSGKHNNWSLCTDTGINLFAPGKNPKGNMLFLTFLVNVLMMVYKNQNLLRASIMSAGNSHRLGANEAPPAILSIFLGRQLSATLDDIVRQVGDDKMTAEEKTTLKLGIGRIPEILLDTTDRNRTSPFAFTGNRFEFRAAGSSSNCAAAMIAINAAMANPILPGISEAEQELLYKKLNEYNQGRTSYKEAGAYLVVLPRPESPRYSLWVYSPLPERQSIFYVQDLSTDIHESLRAASSLCYYSPRCILLVEYNAKRMQSKGDDIISFGKYHGHFLHEIFRIDPAYVSWIAYKFTPRIPKQERFVQIAQVYHSVHLDIQKRQAHQKYSTSRFLGKEGDKVKELTLKVLRVRLEDDPYKTTVKGTTSNT